MLSSLSSLFERSMFLLDTSAEILTADELQAAIDAASASPVMSGALMALCGALGAICVGLVILILMQKKRASGIGAALSGGGETYWSKNKGKSPEGALEKYTKFAGAAFLLVALLINVMM